MPAYLAGAAFIFALLAVTIAALQIVVTALPASGLPATLLITAGILAGLRKLSTLRKATRS